ncbi:MAG: hypothetical protein RJB66_259 [Pseudomonadota bacterium]|jgi:hypothetical protein
MKAFALSFILQLAISCPIFAETSKDNLPDLVSPDELQEELQLPEAKTLVFDGEFETLGIEEWSDMNGIDLTQHFEVVVVVNKAKSGPEAQKAQVYLSGRHYKTFTVSTGREKLELAPSGKVYRSVTPQGWFRPIYFSPNHFSETWKAPMPWAVFFNGGIALHATTRSHYDELGQRASGGCVRLHHDDAKELYHLIKNAGKGAVPKFKQSGRIIRDSMGRIKLEHNYNTLIIVENSQG